MPDLGSVPASSTIVLMFTTHAQTGASVAPLSAYEVADVILYKNNSATQRTSQSGWTMTSPFDSITGLHCLAIDLSDNTDASFYAVGNVYTAVLSADTETVDGLTVVAVIGTFRIVAAETVTGTPEATATAASIAAIIDGLLDNIHISKNTALSNFPFVMRSSSDHISPTTGLTITATRSIDGAAFGACANSASEVGSGVYKINLAAGDLNGNTIMLKFAASGADTTFVALVTQPAD